MSTKNIVVWFRNDLRLSDNPVVFAASQSGASNVRCVYFLDPRHVGTTGKNHWHPTIKLPHKNLEHQLLKMGAARARFLLESLEDLKLSLARMGNELLVVRGRPEEMLPLLVDSGTSVYAAMECTPEEVIMERAVRNSLEKVGATLSLYWGYSLHHMDDLPFRVANTPIPFTKYKQSVMKQIKVRELLPAANLAPPPRDPLQEAVRRAIFAGSIEDLGYESFEFDTRGVLSFKGGEKAGLARLEQYARNGLATYKKTRNGLIGPEYSTKFSAWLSLGCISPRQIYWRCKQQPNADDGTYWVVFELMWRDWFRFVCARHGTKIFALDGPAGKTPVEWTPDVCKFEKWRTGQTGIPFVDANMRELLLTGWMSNRGRQNVASYLIHNMKVDWRLGAMWFEEMLIDHDVCSNYGNWIAAAGGLGGRVNRFNIAKQAMDYDPLAKFVKLWCPEYSSTPVSKLKDMNNGGRSFVRLGGGNRRMNKSQSRGYRRGGVNSIKKFMR